MKTPGTDHIPQSPLPLRRSSRRSVPRRSNWTGSPSGSRAAAWASTSPTGTIGAGNDYQLRIDPKIPGREILVSPEPDEPGERRDIDVVIRDAFDEVRSSWTSTPGSCEVS